MTVRFPQTAKKSNIGTIHQYLAFLLFASTAAAATISPDHPELLLQGIMSAYGAGQTSVVIPAGVYQVPSVNGTHLLFQNMSNFEIDATGVTLVFQDVTVVGVYFYQCHNIHFHGATIYYRTPPFTQGVIQAVASDASSFDIQIEPGYPTNLDDPTYFSPHLLGHLFDSTTRWWKHNVYGDVAGTGTQRLGTNTFRIFTNFVGGAVGDLIGIRSGTGNHMVEVVLSSGMNLSDLTILNASVFGILETGGGDLGANTYSNITMKRGNRPPGAITDPLFSTSADGIHSSQARTGPIIQNCSLEAMADDAIAVHGVYSWVMQASGNTLIVSDADSPFGPNFRVGDTLQLLDTQNEPAGSAIVTGVTPASGFTNTTKSARQTSQDFTVGPYYQITLDRNLTAAFDYLAGNPNASGAGFRILNNSISNHRARGIIVKGNNGTIQENVIDGSTLDGIKAGPELFWSEAGFVSNLLIQNNTISNVGYWAGATAAILIAPDPLMTPPGGYQNVTIEGNTFSAFDVPAIFLSSATGVQVANNIFTNLQNVAPFNPNYFGQNVLPGTLVFVTQSTGVEFGSNTLSQLGPANAYFVETLPGTVVNGVGYVTPVASSDADFSGVQGTANWTYGYFPSGNINAFTLLPEFNSAANRWQHTTFGPPWTALFPNSEFAPNGLNNGVEEWATRRWTSNFAGAVTISGHLAKWQTNPGTGVYGRIYLNHNPLYQQFIAGTDGTGLPYSIGATLNPGDTIDFTVAPNGDDYYDDTTFSGVVLATSSPSQSVTVQTNPTGRQFSVDSGPVQTAPQILQLSPGAHTLSVAATQAAGAGTQYLFTGWSDGGNASHPISVGSTAATYTAGFQLQYQLTILANPVAGGSVSPSSGNYYNAGATLTLTAAAAVPYLFTSWSNGATSNPSQITLNGPTSITATYNLPGLTCAITGDASASVADVQRMINETLGLAPPTDDLNGDNIVTVADVQKVLEAALGLGCLH